MPNIEKLTTLANHLLHGKLGHEKFDFSNFNFTPHKMLISNECGTLGCALGECPIIWPDEWTFDGKHIVLMKEYLDYWDLDAPMIFFGLIMEQAEHLFLPSYTYKTQQPDLYGGIILYADATKEQVANNILEFVKKCQSGK